jgi:hypothetical protein
LQLAQPANAKPLSVEATRFQRPFKPSKILSNILK